MMNIASYPDLSAHVQTHMQFILQPSKSRKILPAKENCIMFACRQDGLGTGLGERSLVDHSQTFQHHTLKNSLISLTP